MDKRHGCRWRTLCRIDGRRCQLSVGGRTLPSAFVGSSLRGKAKSQPGGQQSQGGRCSAQHPACSRRIRTRQLAVQGSNLTAAALNLAAHLIDRALQCRNPIGGCRGCRRSLPRRCCGLRHCLQSVVDRASNGQYGFGNIHPQACQPGRSRPHTTHGLLGCRRNAGLRLGWRDGPSPPIRRSARRGLPQSDRPPGARRYRHRFGHSSPPVAALSSRPQRRRLFRRPPRLRCAFNTIWHWYERRSRYRRVSKNHIPPRGRRATSSCQHKRHHRLIDRHAGHNAHARQIRRDGIDMHLQLRRQQAAVAEHHFSLQAIGSQRLIRIQLNSNCKVQ